MISKGYILVYCTGQYEDYHETLLVFSENRDELKEIENEKNAELMNLRKRFTNTKSICDSYMTHFENYQNSEAFKDQFIYEQYCTAEQLDKFLEMFPIPEELEGIVFKQYEEYEGINTGRLDIIDHDELFSHYSIRELEGL